MHAGFGDGVCGVRLRLIDDVAGHGCRKDYGAGLRAGYHRSVMVVSVDVREEPGALRPGDCSCKKERAMYINVKYSPPGIDGVLNSQL